MDRIGRSGKAYVNLISELTESGRAAGKFADRKGTDLQLLRREEARSLQVGGIEGTKGGTARGGERKRGVAERSKTGRIFGESVGGSRAGWLVYGGGELS